MSLVTYGRGAGGNPFIRITRKTLQTLQTLHEPSIPAEFMMQPTLHEVSRTLQIVIMGVER